MEETAMFQTLALVMLLALAACASPPTTASPPAADTVGPVTFACDDGSSIEATFDNAEEPATALLVRAGQRVTLQQGMSASGARYVSDDIQFWNKGRDATVDWQGAKLECSMAE
jgi:membrane-bound inhibitor of C-type lysozyme